MGAVLLGQCTVRASSQVPTDQRLQSHVLSTAGLIRPVTLKFKWLLRETVQLKTGWKGDMPPEIQGRWKAALKEVVIVEEIRFRRAVKPAGSEGNPEKIAYHDGSKVGSGC